MRYQRAELPLKLDGLAAARTFFAGCMADADPSLENLWVAHVDEQARCVHLSRHPGDAQGGAFPIKTIIADAAQHGSAGIATAAEALDCALLDHLVFAGTECTSLRRLGYL